MSTYGGFGTPPAPTSPTPVPIGSAVTERIGDTSVDPATDAFVAAAIAAAASIGTAHNPQYYGAKGDGVTDDAPSLNACYAANAGGLVGLNPGLATPPVYLIGSRVNVAPGTKTVGSFGVKSGHGGYVGATVLLAPTFDDLGAFVCDLTTQQNFNIIFRDVLVNGNALAGAVVTQALFFLYNPSDCVIDNCKGLNSPAPFILLDANGQLGTANQVKGFMGRNTVGSNVAGIVLQDSCTDTLLDGCDVGICTGAAYYLGAPNNDLVGCRGWGSLVGINAASEIQRITGGRYDYNEDAGVSVSGDFVTLDGAQVLNNSVAGVKAHSEVEVTGSDFTMTGGMCADGAFLTDGTAQALYAIDLQGGHTNATITGVNVRGVANGGINGASSAVGDVVRGCQGFSSNPVATTPNGGTALANGTPAVLSYTTPGDGRLHQVTVSAALHVTTSMVGGTTAINVTEAAAATDYGPVLFAAKSGTGWYHNPDNPIPPFVVGPGATVVLQQAAALTLGAATIVATIDDLPLGL